MVRPELASLADLHAVAEDEMRPADEAFVHVLVLVSGVDGSGTDVIVWGGSTHGDRQST